MSKGLLEPPDEKASPLAPTDQPPQRLRREAGQAGAGHPDVGKTSWRRLTRGRYLAGAGVVIAIALVITVVVAALGTPAKTGTPAATNQVKQVQVPAHQTYNAQPPVAPQSDTVDLTLVAKEALISIAPGVAYHAWIFNGSVPGPILRVRQGQTIHFTLTNDSSMPHSIDFHAAQTPGT